MLFLQDLYTVFEPLTESFGFSVFSLTTVVGEKAHRRLT